MNARDFGMLVPQIKSYTCDIIPNIVIDKHERIAIMRKNGIIRLSDFCGPAKGHSKIVEEEEIQVEALENTLYSPPDRSVVDNKIPQMVSFGLAWDVTNGVNIDLDSSVICLDKNYNMVDVIYFKSLRSKDGSIQHCGDEREGDALGDDETINIKFHEVNMSVEYMGIIINSYSGQELDDVNQASCHLFDTKTKKEIAVYTMTNCRSLDKHTALVMGCFYRTQQNPNDWLLHIISEPALGRTAFDNVDELQNFLKKRSKSQMEPTVLVDDEAEIDLSTAVMPTFVPLPSSEDEINVLTADEYIQISQKTTVQTGKISQEEFDRLTVRG